MEISVDAITQEDAILKTLVTDLAGGFKEIIFPISALKEVLGSGIAYDGSSFQGINAINASDSILHGVEESLVRVPTSIADTDKDEYWIICDIYDVDGKPHSNCARSKLVELQSKLAEAWDGGNLYMGAEPEAYFLEKRENVGVVNGVNTNYFNPKDPKSMIIAEIGNVLGEMGFEIERAHTEVGEDQFEVNWRYDKAERTADQIQIYKIVAHKVARNFGYDVTFLPKPYAERNGSGMHCHLSVANDSANLYYDASAKDQRYFSETARHFLAGILENVRGLSAIANPTEVSFSRLVPGYEAPCIVAIGDRNRSAACRIPAIADEATRKVAIRTEFRFPDPMANPYLLAAGFIATGLSGIEKLTKFTGFCDENLFALSLKEVEAKGYTLLPRNLWEAYREFDKNEILKSKLGEFIHESFGEILLTEIDSCQPYANTHSMKLHYLK